MDSSDHQEMMHTGEKPHACKKCEKTFAYKSQLMTHEKQLHPAKTELSNFSFRIHTGKKPYHCLKCVECFDTESDLKRHDEIHMKRKPFVCSECGTRWRCKRDLKTHDTTHTREKHHACNKCGKIFSCKGNLRKHVMEYHLPGCDNPHAGEKVENVCDCGLKFTLQFSLQRHQQICPSHATKAEPEVITEIIAALPVKEEIDTKVESNVEKEEFNKSDPLDNVQIEVKEELI